MQPQENVTPPSDQEAVPTPPPEVVSAVAVDAPAQNLSGPNGQPRPAEVAPSPPPSSQTPEAHDSIRWEATEYIHDQKTSRWYVGLSIVVIISMLIAWFLMKSWTFMVLIPIMAVALVVLSRRPPDVIYYELTATDIILDQRSMPYTAFKGFGVLERQGHHLINLIPLKRFASEVTILFPEDMGETIVDTLAARLPMIDLEPNAVDTIIRKLHM